MSRYSIAPAALAVCFLMAPAFAQDDATITVAQHEKYGQYLADAHGRALYLFTADTQGDGETAAQVSCSEACLDAWPPLYTEGEPQAEEQVDASLLGTVQHDGKMMVTYNGWPLYYFVRDDNSSQPAGQDIHSFGGGWYLVSPEGEKIEEE
jgi:predicted lipoprotein with Yx(FWY)xxD motif